MTNEKRYVIDNADLMREWHWEKNTELGFNPASLTLGMGRKVWWKCSKGHEWDDTILHRSQGRNCPICSNHRILLGSNNLYNIKGRAAILSGNRPIYLHCQSPYTGLRTATGFLPEDTADRYGADKW